MFLNQGPLVFKLSLMGAPQMDAARAAALAKEHAVRMHGNLAAFSFKLLKVEQNSVKDRWKVTCEFLTTPRDSKPAKYLIVINVKSEEMELIEELKD